MQPKPLIQFKAKCNVILLSTVSKLFLSGFQKIFISWGKSDMKIAFFSESLVATNNQHYVTKHAETILTLRAVETSDIRLTKY